MKRCPILFLLALPLSLLAQFQDNLSDGDFTGNPAWIGETVNFNVATNRLHLNAPAAASSSYLSTASAAIHNASWEFYVEMGFATSSTSLTRVYLVSDQADLKQSLNGYFVMIGNTADEVSLYKQTGATTSIVKVIDGLDARVGASTVSVKIKVTRDAAALWSLFVDVNNTGAYAQEATSVTDATHTISNYFGVYCLYTATRSTLFWFDDFNVTGTPVPDINPPTVIQVAATSSTEVSVLFSELVSSASAQTLTNYLINNTNPSAAVLQPDGKTVLLTLSTPLTNGLNFTAKVSAVTDVSGNALTQSTSNALFFVQYPVSKKDLIISEFMADPSPVVGLPDAEYVEIYNRSANPVQLQNWKLTDGSIIATLPSWILLPSTFVVVTTNSVAPSFANSIGVSSFPSLNNTGDNVILKTDAEITIDSIHYTTIWYHDADKQDGGWSVEIIDPENLCGEETNWTASINGTGGTPALVNSVNASNPDQQFPLIVSATIETTNHIKIVFNEKLAKNLSASAILDLGISVATMDYDLSMREINLYTSSPLQPSVSYTLSLSGVTDCAGNGLPQTTISLILPEQAVPFDIVVNEILFNPNPGGVDFIEVYNRSNKYINLKNWSFANISTQLPTNGKVISNPIIMNPGSYLVFTADTAALKSQYPQLLLQTCIQMTIPTMPDAAGTIALVDNASSFIDSLTYTEQWHASDKREGISLERISFAPIAPPSSNWSSALEQEDFATPGFLNSVSHPSVETIFASQQFTIYVRFNKLMEASSAIDLQNYQVESMDIANIVLDTDGRTAQLHLTNPMVNGLTYKIHIRGVTDGDGNQIYSTDAEVRYFIQLPVQKKDLIISEIMADPSPPVNLFEAEYIELFNRSPNPIQLQGWSISDGLTAAILPDYIVLSGDHVVVTTTSAFSNNSIDVINFPSLNNTSDHIVIKNEAGATIDSITYSDEWYHSEDKRAGGWSLEIIDPENLCEEEGNWTASESTSGGTPGTLNSVNAINPDVTPPTIVSSFIENSHQVVLSFSEKMDKDLLGSIATFEPAVSVQSLQYQNNLKQLRITTSDELEANTTYILSLSGLRDCTGNPLPPNDILLIKPGVANSGDILINEVLFNPKSGGVDFVEVYNTSEKYLNLKKWSLANIENDIPINSKELASAPLIAPKSFMVLSSDPAILKSHYPATIESVCLATTLPSMNDDEGSIAVVDSLGIVMDFFFYKDDYHVAFLKDEEGVSLERVSLNSITNDPNNWRSASQHVNFATPGYKNSASTDGVTTPDGDVLIEPEIFSPQVPPTDFTRINYKFNQSGKVANAHILDQQGRLIKTLANNEVLGTEGFFRWDGDRDDGGRARAGYYVAWLEVFDISGNVSTFRKRVIVSFR